jgi:hypothetical protein
MLFNPLSPLGLKEVFRYGREDLATVTSVVNLQEADVLLFLKLYYVLWHHFHLSDYG